MALATGEPCFVGLVLTLTEIAMKKLTGLMMVLSLAALGCEPAAPPKPANTAPPAATAPAGEAAPAAEKPADAAPGEAPAAAAEKPAEAPAEAPK
jgi:hypothetical protein